VAPPEQVVRGHGREQDQHGFEGGPEARLPVGDQHHEEHVDEYGRQRKKGHA
jgi:hypothetical protein